VARALAVVAEDSGWSLALLGTAVDAATVVEDSADPLASVDLALCRYDLPQR
jgi:hypothetical protein